MSGYLFRSGGDGKPAERIDDQWLEDHFGGGTYDLTIRSKSGKSHYERGVKVAGLPKLTEKEKAVAPVPIATAAVPAAVTAENATLLGLVNKLMDRMEAMQERMENRPVTAGSAAEASGIDVVASAAKRGFELITSAQPAAPAKEMDDLDRAFRAAMIKRLTEPAPAPVENEFDKQLRQAMLDRLLSPPSESKSLVSQLKELGELRELLGWGGDAGGGRPEHWTTALIGQAPALMNTWVEGNQTRERAAQAELERTRIIANAQRGVRTPPPPGAPPPNVQTSANPAAAPGRPPAGAPPAARPLRMTPIDGSEPPPAAPAPEATVPPPNFSGINTESPEMVQFVKEGVVRLVQGGESGGGIIGFLVGMHQEKFIDLLVQYSPEQITAYLQTDPILHQAAENPDWRDILAEARDYVRDNQVPPGPLQ